MSNLLYDNSGDIRPEEPGRPAAMTAEEAAALPEWARRQGLLPVQRKQWAPCAPASPEELALARAIPRPVRKPGQTGDDWAYLDEDWWARDKKRLTDYLALGRHRITQIQMDLAFNDPDEDYFECRFEAVNADLDVDMPPALVRSEDAATAGARYLAKNGVTNYDRAAHTLIVKPWSQQVAA